MSQSSRDIILARIQQALAQAPEPELVAMEFRTRDEQDQLTHQAEFIDRLLDYKALVTTTETADLPGVIAAACKQHTIQSLVAPADLPPAWLPSQITILPDAPLLALADIDASDGVLSGCALAIAQTGTIILDGGARQGRRVLSLIPDRFLCVVEASQIVGLVPQAIARLAASPERPLTFISGPSATSDIELNRVEGVHGPRLLHVILLTDR